MMFSGLHEALGIPGSYTWFTDEKTRRPPGKRGLTQGLMGNKEPVDLVPESHPAPEWNGTSPPASLQEGFWLKNSVTQPEHQGQFRTVLGRSIGI